MSTNTMELSMENMELANGGFSPLACVLGTIFGAGKGALAGGALGLAAGPVGAAAGALVGGIVGDCSGEEGFEFLVKDSKYSGTERGLGNKDLPDVGTKK